MTEQKEKSLFQKDRRQSLRAESTDRRDNLRASKRLIALRVIVGIILLVIGFFAVYLINPKF